MKRAVSLVPSATDVAVALGAAEALVGISADCDQPEPALPRPVVTRPWIDQERAATDAVGVDLAVREQLASGGPLYSLDVARVVSLRPDVVFAQDSCGVCALPSSEVVAALAAAGAESEVVSVDPRDLEDVLSSFSTIGRALGLAEEGARLELSYRASLGTLADRAGAKRRPRVAVLDWVDPPYLAGNWVPDLVRAAGGEPALRDEEGPSREITLEALVEARPDAVVVAPCGLEMTVSVRAAEDLCRRAPLVTSAGREAGVIAFDGRVWFSRPGPRLLEGAEALAAWLSGGVPASTVAREVRGASR